MPFILALLVLYFPRLLLVYLKFFAGWFSAGPNLLWQVLGFFFAPFTLLWVAVVQHSFGGHWDMLQKVVLVIAVIVDLGGGFGATRNKKH